MAHLEAGDSAIVYDVDKTVLRVRLVKHRFRSLIVLGDSTAWRQRKGEAPRGLPGTDNEHMRLEKQGPQ